ncbi:hypothetical protein J2Z48_001661 [Croceifilum oryzae]|uniref:Uncharacterized protein n=1 Tax=Croceifilum oryzae TaxID=1553429 RepID=A0AAJ1WSL1_9BACL|nr:hypothetical protein [Croceifilum oryzae]MDQ0417488.1 hypothetical protein [Croceifilum oryzae]
MKMRKAELATTGIQSGAAVAVQVGAFVAGSTQSYIIRQPLYGGSISSF